MKLTKFVHSCVLAENEGHNVLFDPGQMSWDSGLINIGNLPEIHEVVITHEHFDHFSEDFVRQLITKFPEAVFITTPSVAAKLKELGAANVTTDSTDHIKVFSKSRHAPLEPFAQAPDNIAVHFDDKLTVGGDRHDLEESKEILALTATAPWGSLMAAAAMALKLNPKSIFPVHDWHWNEKARAGSYDMMDSLFSQKGIKFVKTVDGESFEL